MFEYIFSIARPGLVGCEDLVFDWIESQSQIEARGNGECDERLAENSDLGGKQ